MPTQQSFTHFCIVLVMLQKCGYAKGYGRCYTAQPTKEMMSFGIRKVSIIVWARSIIFFHNPGMLTTDRQRNFIDIDNGRKFEIDMEYEIFQMLDFGGRQCINDKSYDKDICAQENLFQVSTWPFYTLVLSMSGVKQIYLQFR